MHIVCYTFIFFKLVELKKNIEVCLRTRPVVYNIVHDRTLDELVSFRKY